MRSDVIATLEQHGFYASPPESEQTSFTGRIVFACGLEARVRLDFHEGEFNFPKAVIENWNDEPGLRAALKYAHIDGASFLCYVDESLTWWDSARAAESVDKSIKDIKALLEKKYYSESDNIEIIQRDFPNYWDSTNKLHLLAYPQNNDRYSAEYFEFKQASHIQSLEKNNTGDWQTICLNKAPKYFPGNTPIDTLKDFLSWIKRLGSHHIKRTMQTLQNLIKSSQRGKSPLRVGLIYIWPSKNFEPTIGVGVQFTLNSQQYKPIQTIKPIVAFNHLFRFSFGSLDAYNVQRADPAYIYNRNLSDNSPLKNRKIILIGAGNIGSHLAALLCSAGSGGGSKGELFIIDNDVMEIGNIGRHTLGYNSVGYSKANALKHMLSQQYRHLKLTDKIMSFYEFSASMPKDKLIIIDATGNQSLSSSLPILLDERKVKGVVFHTSIYGHGAATISFFNDRTEPSACFNCLGAHDEHGKFSFRYPLDKNNSDFSPVRLGCHSSYHPYPASVSMRAASQCFDHIMDVLKNRAPKTLQFQVLDKAKCQNRKDVSPTPNCARCR